ncbi:MAG: PQQ-dependent sugar dehydrogenase [Pseudomonadota bacterium]
MFKFVARPLLLIIPVMIGFTTSSQSQQSVQTHDTQKASVKVEKVASGIDTPWAMAMLPDGKLLVTERDGKMLLVDPANAGRKTEVSGLPRVKAAGQGGLLDVVLDPDFAANRTLYLTYSDPDSRGNAGTAIASARFEESAKPSLKDVKVLFSMENKNRSGFHFGSRIVPDGKGNLFFTIGDRGTEERAQDPFDAAGSVLRIRTDGSIPEDNPYADGKDALPQIWSIGHRNPQGATLNDATGELWTLAHGARGGDEINIPQAGRNYGWPVISYGTHYSGGKIGIGNSGPGMEQPIYFWDPSIAPSGFDFYQGDLIPQWKGDLFAGALKFETLVRLEVQGNRIVHEERLFEEDYGRIRDVRFFPDGALWFLTDDSDGAIYRVTSAE